MTAASSTLVSHEDLFHSAVVFRFGRFVLELPLSSLDSECRREGVLHVENEFGRFRQFGAPFDSEMMGEDYLTAVLYSMYVSMY